MAIGSTLSDSVVRGTAFADIDDWYPVPHRPFLTRALERSQRHQPYAGIRILHHIPLTWEAVPKIAVFAIGGADITVASPSFAEPVKEAVDVLERAGITVLQQPSTDIEVDVMLDCGGELCGQVTPRLGACELTDTGTARYRAAELDYPVITVDECRVRDLDALLGTGEAFVRAFRELVAEPAPDQAFLLIGFGKVGRGIARALRRYTGTIAAVDVDEAALAAAQAAGLEAIPADDTARVEQWARNAFAVVTATGLPGVVSDRYDPDAFRGRHLVNMGGEDEFGAAFADDEVLCQKQPVNVAVSDPTLMRYRDPVFHAHNLGVDLLRYSQLSPGVHPFPDFLADEIVETWQRIFGERLDSTTLTAPHLEPTTA